MRSTRHAALVFACLALPLSALAQGSGPGGAPGHDARGQTPPEMVTPQPNRPANPETGTPMSAEEARANLAEMERARARGAVPVRAGDLELVSASGERLGEVEDVMLDGEGGVAGYVVETGGVLGIGERNLFVPRDAVRLERDPSGRPVLRTDRQLSAFQEASRRER